MKTNTQGRNYIHQPVEGVKEQAITNPFTLSRIHTEVDDLQDDIRWQLYEEVVMEPASVPEKGVCSWCNKRMQVTQNSWYDWTCEACFLEHGEE